MQNQEIAEAHVICGAHSRRTGKPCQSPPMPNGRCRMHGGKTPIKHGLYSKATKRDKDIIARTEELLESGDLLDLRSHLALTVALLERAVNNLSTDDGSDLEKAKAVGVISTNLARVAETQHKFDVGFYLKPDQVQALLQLLGATIKRTCIDCPKLKQLAASIAAVPMPE